MFPNLKSQKYYSKNAHNPNTDWFSLSGYGLFLPTLPSKEEFPIFLRDFDAKTLAEDIHKSGAGYAYFAVCQNNGPVNVPSETYLRATGAAEWISGRDLVKELSDALSEYGIRLMLYVPSGAPQNDEAMAHTLGCRERDNGITNDWIATDEFIGNWCEFFTELSLRYSERISGWWVDGFYEWDGYTNEIAARYSSALKSGNPKAIVCFNGGAETYFYPSEYDDYLPGEWNRFDTMKCDGRWLNGVQWHEVSYLGERWDGGTLQFTAEEVAAHLREVNEKGGVISIDPPMEHVYTRLRPDTVELLGRVREMLTNGSDRN